MLLIAAHAEIYHYRNEDGHNVYVDNLSSVPAQFRQEYIDESEGYDEDSDELYDQYDEDKNSESTDWDSRWQELIADSQTDEVESSAQTTPVTIINNQVVVPVTVRLKRREVELHLLLDTGASITLLHQQSIRKLKVGKTRSRRAKLANGSTVDIKVAKMSELTVGPIALLNTPVAIIESQGRRQQHDGLLGMDVLRHRPFNIDHYNEQIIWQ